MLDELRNDLVHGVDRDGEADAGARPARRGDGRVHPDEAARAVEERSSRVPGVDGGVGLDDPLDLPSRHRLDRPSEGAHDPGRERLVEAERVADGEDLLPDEEILRGADEDRPQRRSRREDPEDGEVAVGGGADERRRPGRAVGERHARRGRPLDDVEVRDDVACRVPDEARTLAPGNLGHPEEAGLAAGEARDEDDRGARLAEERRSSPFRRRRGRPGRPPVSARVRERQGAGGGRTGKRGVSPGEGRGGGRPRREGVGAPGREPCLRDPSAFRLASIGGAPRHGRQSKILQRSQRASFQGPQGASRTGP